MCLAFPVQKIYKFRIDAVQKQDLLRIQTSETAKLSHLYSPLPASSCYLVQIGAADVDVPHDVLVQLL